MRFDFHPSFATSLGFLLLASWMAGVAPLRASADEPNPETETPAAAETAEVEAAVAAPKIVCDEPEHPFGNADNSEVIEHTFVIRNAGTATLEITDIRPDCGCTLADISSRSMEPGGQAELTARLNLKGRYGLLRKRVRVFSNDPDTPQYAVLLTGTATSLLEVQPRTLLSRGTSLEALGVLTVTVACAESHPLPIESLTTGNPHVDAELVVVEPDFSYEMLLRPKDSLPNGQTQGNLKIVTGSERYPDITVPYTFLRVATDFILAPDVLVLQENPNQAIIRQFIVRPGLVTDFAITEVIPPSEDIAVDIRPVTGGTMIRLREMRVTREMDGTVVRILTDAEGTDPIELPIRVISRPRPAS